MKRTRYNKWVVLRIWPKNSQACYTEIYPNLVKADYAIEDHFKIEDCEIELEETTLYRVTRTEGE